jgi:ABC-2 type transport system permease protein
MEYLRLLFWLKWTLMWRRYQQNAMALVGVIVALVFFLPMSLGVGIGTGYAYHALSPAWAGQLLRAVLLGIYLIWIFAPLLGYALNESYDITKLFLFPLTTRQLFTGAIFGAIIDFPVLLATPALLAIIIGFPHSAASLLITVLAVLIFFFHTLSMSQTVLLASESFLRSRRYRDIMLAVAPLLAAFFYLSFQLLPHLLFHRSGHFDYHQLTDSTAWEVVSYLPPGIAARAITAGAQGHDLAAGGLLLILGVVALATVYLAGWLLEKICTGTVESGSAARPARAKTARTRATSQPVGTAARVALPPVVTAIFQKELKYFQRDPAFKAMLMQFIYLFVVFFVYRWNMSMYTSGYTSSYHPPTFMLWMLAWMPLFLEASLTSNIFGVEGDAIGTLLLFPSSRRQIMQGKNLALFLALWPLNAIIVVIGSMIANAASLIVPLIGMLTLASIVLIAAGNLTSICFPYRIVRRGWRMQTQSAGGGCGRSLVAMGVMACVGILLLPVIAAVLAPVYLIGRAWLALTVPLAVLYVVSGYLLSLRLSVPLLQQREQRLIAALTKAEE